MNRDYFILFFESLDIDSFTVFQKNACKGVLLRLLLKSII